MKDLTSQSDLEIKPVFPLEHINHVSHQKVLSLSCVADVTESAERNFESVSLEERIFDQMCCWKVTCFVVTSPIVHFA